MKKTDEKMLAYLIPMGEFADTYLCFVGKYSKDTAMYSMYNQVESWVKKNGGTIKKLSEDKKIVGEHKGFMVRIRFPMNTKRDMKQIMAALYRRGI